MLAVAAIFYFGIDGVVKERRYAALGLSKVKKKYGYADVTIKGRTRRVRVATQEFIDKAKKEFGDLAGYPSRRKYFDAFYSQLRRAGVKKNQILAAWRKVIMPDGVHVADYEYLGPPHGGRRLGLSDHVESGGDGPMPPLPKGRKAHDYPTQSWYTHTEGKIIHDLWKDGRLKPGAELEITAVLPPCTNCQTWMQWLHKNSK